MVVGNPGSSGVSLGQQPRVGRWFPLLLTFPSPPLAAFAFRIGGVSAGPSAGGLTLTIAPRPGVKGREGSVGGGWGGRKGGEREEEAGSVGWLYN